MQIGTLPAPIDNIIADLLGILPIILVLINLATLTEKKIKNKVCRNILKRSPYSLLTKVCFDSDSSSQLIHIPEFGY